MPSLKILYPNGDIDRYPLSKLAPVSIGSHSSNDISLNEAGVDVLHCRIAWAKSGYEALAAGGQGIEVNGAVVQRALLKAGDVLRFGGIDVLYREKDVVPAGTAKRDEPPASTKNKRGGGRRPGSVRSSRRVGNGRGSRRIPTARRRNGLRVGSGTTRPPSSISLSMETPRRPMPSRRSAVGVRRGTRRSSPGRMTWSCHR